MKQNSLNFTNKIIRSLWQIVWLFLFRPTPDFLFSWRNMLLHLFGAKIGQGVHVYPSVKIWAPWNLEMSDQSSLGPSVNCYCVDKVKIGSLSIISQNTHLCTATHDYTDPCALQTPYLPLITAPIIIENYAWVTADVFIAPGVTIGEGGVVLARSTVVKNVPPWTVVAGSPAIFKKKRVLLTK